MVGNQSGLLDKFVGRLGSTHRGAVPLPDLVHVEHAYVARLTRAAAQVLSSQVAVPSPVAFRVGDYAARLPIRYPRQHTAAWPGQRRACHCRASWQSTWPGCRPVVSVRSATGSPVNKDHRILEDRHCDRELAGGELVTTDDSPRLKPGGSNDPTSFLKLSHHRS